MKRYQSAFTFYDLLICLTLISIFSTIAIPAFAHLVKHHRDMSLRNQLVALLIAARTQAITHQQTRIVCGSNTGTHCTGHWQHHWLLSHDSHPIQVIQPPQDSQICWSGFTSTIKYQSNGTSPASNGRFYLCRDGVAVWSLILNRQGRIKLADADTTKGCC